MEVIEVKVPPFLALKVYLLRITINSIYTQNLFSISYTYTLGFSFLKLLFQFFSKSIFHCKLVPAFQLILSRLMPLRSYLISRTVSFSSTFRDSVLVQITQTLYFYYDNNDFVPYTPLFTISLLVLSWSPV